MLEYSLLDMFPCGKIEQMSEVGLVLKAVRMCAKDLSDRVIRCIPAGE